MANTKGVRRMPDPPAQYNQTYMEQLVSAISSQMRDIATDQFLRGVALNLTNLPQSATGLRSGDVWVDLSASNVLKIVP